MAPDPAPPPIILAIPAPSPPPNPSSLSPNPAPPSIASDLSSSPPDPACPPPVLPPPRSGPAPASSGSPANQDQLSRRDLPADLLCFQHLLPPSSSFESPSAHQFPAAPEPPPAAPTVSAAPSSPAILPLSSSLHHPPADSHIAAQPAVLQLRPQPVRQNALVSSGSEPLPAVPPESAAPLPPLSGSPPKLPHHADAPLPALPSALQQRAPSVRHNAQANPLLPKSYAQAAKGTPGPGFVRAHARDVDSFARLPRTGINTICGSHEGIPACSIVQSDLPKVEGLYAKAVIMKFHGGRPSLAASHKEISSWGFESPFSIGPLTSRSFLLRFQEERDLLKILTRPSSTLINFPYKIFRWHNRCHIKEDSCMVPIWISLPRLPLQCFAPEYLESFASLIGRFLCLDKATATLARPSEARMCIEIDLRKERPQFIWIGLFEGFKQPIVYERVPKFCMGCHMQGHNYVECSKNTLDTLQSKDSGPIHAFQERSQAVRRNAKESSAAAPQQSSSVAASAAPLLASDTHHQDLPQPLPSNSKPFSSPCPDAAVPPITQDPCPAAAVPLIATDPHLHQSALPLQQSGISMELHPPRPLSSSSAKASPSASPFPTAAVFPVTSVLHPSSAPPPSSKVQPEVSWTVQTSAAVPPPVLSVPAAATHPPPPSEAKQGGTPTIAPPAAVRSSALSAQAAPFPPSNPVQSSQQNNQNSSSPLGVYVNANGAKCMAMPSRPLWERVNRQLGIQGHLSSIIHAPSPSYNHHQFHALEGYDSEGSFETDSQPNSPLESPKEDANKCPFLSQSCVSEGEQPTEEHPGFQGHISDVEFYHQPMSSKKNKRQPDGPLRVQLRTRKGRSVHR